MTGKFTVEQKYQIVMESYNSTEAVSVLCRRHGVAPINFRKWREKFIEGGKKALGETREGNELEAENRDLKRLIGEQALVIDAFKKTLQERKR